MTEQALKLRTIKALRAQEFEGIYFFKSHDLFTSGVPDLIGCFHSVFFGFELKSIKGLPTALQIYNIKKIRKAGGVAHVCYSVEEVVAHLRKIRRDRVLEEIRKRQDFCRSN